MEENLSVRVSMKRRTADHIPTDDLLPKQRIVRRKLQRSLSPVDLESRSTKRLRELREEKQDLYEKYNHRTHEEFAIEKYSPKYDHQPRKSTTDIREERVSKGGYSERPHRIEYSSSHFEDVGGSRTRDVHLTTGRREPLPLPSSGPRPSDTFEYSLRVANIDYKLTDNVVKASLFKEFKRFGYVNIKVIGYGRDRHAYINFNRASDANAACHDMQNFLFHGRPLEVGWSRSTLNRFPDLLTGKFHEPRSSGFPSPSTKKRHVEESYGTFQVIPQERDQYSSSSSRTIRDISIRNSSSSSRDRTQHSTTSDKQSVAVLDPNATRTLFVGNLEMDITERELRDIFSPYGRIESVDIKTTRSTAYSFVKFFTINDAINAKNELNGRQYGNLRLSIGFGKGTPSAKVWIGNVTCHADVSEIRKELDRFGLIRRVDYVNDDNHAFVHFDGLDAAEAAVASLKNYRFKRTNKLLKIDLMQHQPHRDLGGSFDDFDTEMGSYDSVVTSTTGGTIGRNEDGPRFRTREFHKETVVRDSQFRPRERTGGRVMSEGTNNSPQYTTEKFRHSYNRKRERSPHMHNDRNPEYNGDYRPKRSRNGFDAYEYHKLYKRTERVPPRDRPRYRLGSNEDGVHKDRNHDRERDKKPVKDDPNHKNEEQEESKSINSGGTDIPPPPSTIPTDTFDTALNLNTSEVQAEEDAKLVKADAAETLGDLAKLYPMAWRGNLVLKNTGFPTRMHLIGGDPAVVEMLVRCREGKEDASSLRITQRLRLEPPRLDEVNKRMASAGPSGHCILIALPGPTPSQSSSPDHSINGIDNLSAPSMQLRPLRSLVSYLKQKEAAGIVALNATGDKNVGDLNEMSNSDKDNVGVLHAFPPCEFSQNQLLKVAPNLGAEPAKEDHIVVLLVKGTV